ncbi:Meiotic Sister-Chromatid recombination aldehyde dehydrogenase [Borealophlyctis nickersoniae]|nr:Meiotic Sister-Chromatid recombination aldehyde dehydrogenase [Borealophlyctis nickersoniae]
MHTAAPTLTPVVLALGGKDCIVAFDDCDYNQILHTVVRCAFQNSGQNCAGLERLIVQEGIYERMVKDFGDDDWGVEGGTPIGRDSADEMAKIDVIQRLVDHAVAKGARLLAGGKHFIHRKYPKGQFYTTLLADITPDMLIAKNQK